MDEFMNKLYAMMEGTPPSADGVDTKSNEVGSSGFEVGEKNVERKRKVYFGCPEEEEDSNQEFPIYMAMADTVVTPSGFSDTKKKDELCSKIRLMSGEVSFAFTSRTTHLLATHANTAKVSVARLKSIPVISTEWLEGLWKACERRYNPYIHWSLPEFVECIHSPLFYNLNLVFSKRFDEESKRFYKILVEALGGRICKTLKNSPNYLYICQEPETERQYLYAQAKEISCVPLAWISDSVFREFLANIREYEIRGKCLDGFGETFDCGSEADLHDTNGKDPGTYKIFDSVDDAALLSSAVNAKTKKTELTWVERTIDELNKEMEENEDEDEPNDGDSTLNATVIEIDDDDDDDDDDTLTSVAA